MQTQKEREKRCKKGSGGSGGKNGGSDPNSLCESPKFQTDKEAIQWINDNCPDSGSLGTPDGIVVMVDGMFCARCGSGGSSGNIGQTLPEY